MRRHLATTTLAAVTAAALTAGIATANRDHEGGDQRPAATYAIGLWGDLPYSDEQASVGVPNLLRDMNSQRLAFSVHDGDIKAGSTRCDDPVYTQAKQFFNSLDAPAMYAPGDNDWTDCDRPAAGGYNSNERLAHLRATLFDSSYSFGRHRIPLEAQAAPYIENRRWQVGDVTYATLHVVGSDNNLGDTAPDPAEEAARDAATNSWLRETFAVAKQRGSTAVMLVAQANPGFDKSDTTRAPSRDPKTLEPKDGFYNFLTVLREETIAFKRPVALVHGDSHYFRIDKPLLDAQGRRLENFTRVETFGDNQANGNNDVQWVKVTVDSESRDVFAFQPQIVNRVAVPAP